MYRTQSAAMKLKRAQQYHGPKYDWDELAQILVGEYIFFIFMINATKQKCSQIEKKKKKIVFQTLNITMLMVVI